MAVPLLVTTYPADNDTGIPVGITIKLYFDTGIDLTSLKNSVALYGQDFDMTSGPDSTLWIDKDTGNNPFFLNSPGFKGLVPLKFELSYYTLGTATEVGPVITTQADEISENVGHLAKITIDPKFNAALSADTAFTLVIAGDPDNQGIGISARTVFDEVADAGNTGSGDIGIYGTWIDPGVELDEINVEITVGGNTGTARYKWWYTSGGPGSAVNGLVTSRKNRSLRDGLQIKFTGNDFVSGDSWKINVSKIQRLEASTIIHFNTNDGSYSAPPESPSTPALSVPPLNVLPTRRNPFEVIKMVPQNGTYNVRVNNRKIVITFSEEIDAATITNESVKLTKYPVSGSYDSTYNPVELQKTIDVDEDTITIRF